MLALAFLAASTARVALGQYGRWGAFREERPRACFAIAEPVSRRKSPSRPSVAVASWPGRRIAAQLHVRLRESRPGQAVALRIGDLREPLVVAALDAWTRDARADIRVVAAMRRADTLYVEAREPRGRHYVDRYPLAGAASAIDAAAVGCLDRSR